MNFHNLVRSVITTVNPDILGTWRQSNGSTVDAGGRSTPTYVEQTNVPMQVQAQSGEFLKMPSGTFAMQQGVFRDVYIYGNYQGINRPNDQGGDLLIFPETPGGPNKLWLVTVVYESWPDWSKVKVVLQTDAAL